MRNTLKNFWIVISRHSLPSALNLLGLAVAFAAFIVIMTQVRWELNHGQTDRAADSIYSLQIYDPLSSEYRLNHQQHLADPIAQSSAKAIDVAHLLYGGATITIERDGQKEFHNSIPITFIKNDISTLFDFKMLSGEFRSVLEPNSAIINRSLSEKLFSTTTPTNAVIEMHGTTYGISGVYDDLPSNAHLKNGVVIHRKGGTFQLYVKLAKSSDTTDFCTTFRSIDSDLGGHGLYNPSKMSIRLLPLSELYFDSNTTQYFYMSSGNRATNNILIIIAALLIAIAVINFTNFYTALSPIRVRAFNTKLIFGASRFKLRSGVIAESLMMCLVGFGLGLILIELVEYTPIKSLLKVDTISVGENLDSVLYCLAITIVIGLVAGIYPAQYATKFNTALALKGSAMSSKRGLWLRSTLVGVQFVISISLIIFTFFINNQYRTLIDAPLGFDTQNLLRVDMDSPENVERLSAKLNQLPSVESSASINGSFGEFDCDVGGAIQSASGAEVEFKGYLVSAGFFNTLGVKILDGRDFDATDGALFETEEGKYITSIYSRSAAKLFGHKIGDIGAGDSRVVGIVEDIISKSAVEAIEPLVYFVGAHTYTLLIRTVKGSSHQAFDDVNSAIKEIEPTNTPTLKYYSEAMNRHYDEQQNMRTLLLLFSVIAILISMVGVLGLLFFDTMTRRKEIALRKVYGASTNEIVNLFNYRYLTTILISFAIAAPISIYLTNWWLEGFAIRTELSWWVFASALLMVGALTYVSVTLLTLYVSQENPIKNLKL